MAELRVGGPPARTSRLQWGVGANLTDVYVVRVTEERHLLAGPFKTVRAAEKWMAANREPSLPLEAS